MEHPEPAKDWPLLEQAVDTKIEEQAEFVQWWRDTIGKNYGGKRRGNQVPRTADLNLTQAEELTGITSQQVSKWAKRLKDLPAYRARLYGAAWKQAMGEGGATDSLCYLARFAPRVALNHCPPFAKPASH